MINRFKHHKKKIFSGAVLIAILAAFVFVRCGKEKGLSSTDGNPTGATFTTPIKINLDPVGALGKSTMISLSKLVFTLTSSANDTIRDTLTSFTTPSLNPTSTSPQTLVKGYTLKALRSWKIVAYVKDVNDVVIHKDSASIPVLYAGDTVQVALTLSSLYSMYEARFLTIPDSISATTPGTLKQVLRLNRLVLKVDGVTRVDSTVFPGPYFTALATAILSYDYVTVGSHTIQLLAYGPFFSWNSTNPLYSGSVVINAGAGADISTPLTLLWVGPNTGTGRLTTIIGKVGKVTVNGTLPGTVMP